MIKKENDFYRIIPKVDKDGYPCGKSKFYIKNMKVGEFPKRILTLIAKFYKGVLENE